MARHYATSAPRWLAPDYEVAPTKSAALLSSDEPRGSCSPSPALVRCGVDRIADALAAWRAGDEPKANTLVKRIELDGAPAERAHALILGARMQAIRGEVAAAIAATQAQVVAAPAPALAQLVAIFWQIGLRDAARDAWQRLCVVSAEHVGDIADVIAAWSADNAQRGLLLGRYRLGARLGSGATASIVEAIDERDGSVVAVKRLHASAMEVPAAVARSLAEAAVMRDPHPHWVRLLDAVPAQGLLVLERMHATLASLMEAGPLSGEVVRRVAVGVSAALRELHARGYVHRDVTPANIFFDGRGTVRVGDFGLVNLAGVAMTLADGGAPHWYLAPEFWQGAAASVATDAYAVGVVLFQAMSGTPPFPDAPGSQLEAPQLPTSIPAVWRECVAALLAADPAERLVAWQTLCDQCGTWPAWNAVAPVARVRSLTAPAIAWSTPRTEHGVAIATAVDALGRVLVREQFVDNADGWDRARRLARLPPSALQLALDLDEAARTVVWLAPPQPPHLAATPLTPAARARLLVQLRDAGTLLKDHAVTHGSLVDALVVCDDVLTIDCTWRDSGQASPLAEDLVRAEAWLDRRG